MGYIARERGGAGGGGNIAEANKQNSTSNIMHGTFWMKELE